LEFSASLLVIPSLTYEFPFHFEIWVATASMMVTYASAIFAVTHHYLLITASVPFISRFVIYSMKLLIVILILRINSIVLLLNSNPNLEVGRHF
jgi:hypothetical protein